MGRAIMGAKTISPAERQLRKGEPAPLGIDDVCRRLHRADLATLRERLGDDGTLSVLKSDSLRHPSSTMRRTAVIHALAAIEGIPVPKLPSTMTYALFVRRALTGWLWALYGNSPYRALNQAYPGRFLPHHMARAPMRHWSGRGGRERAAAALREALEATGHPQDLHPRIVTERFLEEFKLTAPLQKLFGSQFAFLDAAYPGRFRPWEMASTPKGFFDTKKNVVAAVRWMVEERLGIAMPKMTVADVWRENIADRVTKEVFQTHGLTEITATHGSPEPVMRMAYPGLFLPWSFQRKGKWQGEEGLKLAAQATRWLFDVYLQVPPTDPRVTCETFRQNGLWGMLTSRALGFRSSPLAALKNAYPEISSQLRRPPARGRTRVRIPIPTGRHQAPVGPTA